MASEDEVSEFLSQNREAAAWVEAVRGECESDKMWRYRREFILRNLSDFCGPRLPPLHSNDRALDRVLAYSMVWSNHVFTGCRYPQPVMEKVLEMAGNLKVKDAPVHTCRDDLVSKVKKRGIASNNEGGLEEPSKKIKPIEEMKVADSSSTKIQEPPRHETQVSSDRDSGDLNPCTSATQRTDTNLGNCETSQSSQPVSTTDSKPAKSPAVAKSEPIAPQEKIALVEIRQETSTKSTLQSPIKPPRKLTVEDTKERQAFFNRLYKAVAWKLVSAGGFSQSLNHTELLNSCIESLKASLDIAFVPLKELADLPQNKTSQENMVCELRCKAVYLGMGCGKSKDNAKAVASREAIKLFLKKKVVVRICKRKYSGRDVEDLVLLDEESRSVNLPPALKNPQDLL
uniref:CDKN2A interacting protein n=1 Tax=Leptobrachium leishanense TaxID=445787 RepID=A0A8C5Q7H5_9ANUR